VREEITTHRQRYLGRDAGEDWFLRALLLGLGLMDDGPWSGQAQLVGYGGDWDAVRQDWSHQNSRETARCRRKLRVVPSKSCHFAVHCELKLVYNTRPLSTSIRNEAREGEKGATGKIRG